MPRNLGRGADARAPDRPGQKKRPLAIALSRELAIAGTAIVCGIRFNQIIWSCEDTLRDGRRTELQRGPRRARARSGRDCAGAQSAPYRSIGPGTAVSGRAEHGRHLSTLEPKTAWDVWVLPLTGDRTPSPLFRSSFSEFWARISPDGRWLAYVSTESGPLQSS